MTFSFRRQTYTETRHEISILRRLRVPLLAVCLAFVPSAKADIFKYDVQLTSGTITVAHVIFELPSFEETVDNQTTFDLATWNNAGFTLNDFSISGNSTDCVVGLVSTSGPCAILASFSGTKFSRGHYLSSVLYPDL